MIVNDMSVLITCFNPNLDFLIDNLKILSVFNVYVADNSQKNEISQKLENFTRNYPNIKYIDNKSNIGISQSLNQVLNLLPKKTKYLIFLDQDTKIQKKDIKKLLQDFLFVKKSDKSALAIGASFSKNNEAPYFIRSKGWLFHRVFLTKNNIIPVDYLILSGMLIDFKLLKKCQLPHGFYLDENLFVDNVDIELCERVRYFGYKIYGTFNVTITHDLGILNDNLVKFGFTKHAPFRYNSMYRSLVEINKKNYFDFKSKLFLTLKFIMLITYQLIFNRERYLIIKELLRND